MSCPRGTVVLDQLWIRRIDGFDLPDPEYNPEADPDWAQWTAKPAKYERDAADYWFHSYQPSPGDTIVDIGAGRGEDTWAFSRAVGPTGKVWAIEPHPVSFLALQKLVERNGLSNVVPIQVACTDREEMLRIETLPVWESNYVHSGPATPSSFPVRGVRLDRLASELSVQRIDFLKMNIEGAETHALPGCTGVIEHVRAICAASHDFRADRGEGESFRTRAFVRDYLSAAGFVLHTRDTDPRYYVPYHVHGVR